jgi:surface-anchored protein
VVYDTDSFGTPELLMSSLDGVGPEDSVLVPAGEHRHVNWAFSAPGDYTVTFEASGILQAGSQFTDSGPVDYFFHVEAVPEPGTLALLGLGGAMLLLRRRSEG